MKTVRLLLTLSICIISCKNKSSLDKSYLCNNIILKKEFSSNTNNDSLAVNFLFKLSINNQNNKDYSHFFIDLSNSNKLYLEGIDYSFYKDSLFDPLLIIGSNKLQLSKNSKNDIFISINKIKISKGLAKKLFTEHYTYIEDSSTNQSLPIRVKIKDFLKNPEIAKKMNNVNDSVFIRIFDKKKKMIILKERINYK